MIIKGKFHDVIKTNGKISHDRGWNSNSIVPDYGSFLASLMKKAFNIPVGIEYMAVGSGSDGNFITFKQRIAEYFEQVNTGNTTPLFLGPDNTEPWVWAKRIDPLNLEYINENGEVIKDTPTSKLKVEITFEQNEPTGESEVPLIFREFALVGIPQPGEGEPFTTSDLFMVNYVGHEAITKVSSMDLTRTVHLSFPIDQ